MIIARSLLDLDQSHSFHLAGTVSGSVKIKAVSGMIGLSLPLSGNLDLSGGKIAGDVDVDNQAAKVNATFPSLFGLSVDVIEVGGYSYTKVNLTSDKYTRSRADISAVASAASAQASSGIADAVSGIGRLFESSGASAVLVGHDTIDTRDAFKIDLSIPADSLRSDLGSLAPNLPQDSATQSASGTYWAYVDTLTPAQLELKVTSGSLGNLDVIVTFTMYGESVAILAPPADQIQ